MIVVIVVQKDLCMEFDINVLFFIFFDNVDYWVVIFFYNFNVFYEYYVVFKLDFLVYFVVQILGWEKLNLFSGELNLYFDGIFIGKSYIDVNIFCDMFNFLLGKDCKIVIDCKKFESMSKIKLFGSKCYYEV